IIDRRLDWEMERTIHKRLGGQCSFLPLDLLSPGPLLQRAITNSVAVIHLAGDKSVRQSLEQPIRYYQNNVGTLANVLHDRFQENHWKRRIIFSGSATVYASGPSLTEESPTGPSNPYGFSKLFCEKMLEDACKADSQLQAVSLRYFNPVFAECDEFEERTCMPENLVPAIHEAIEQGYPLSLYGQDYDTRDGTTVRDYIHVMDVAEAHVSVLRYMEEQPVEDYGFEVFNVGSGRGLTVLEMIRAYEKHYALTVPYEIHPRRPGDVPVLYASTNKLQTATGWGPARPFA
ncbi:MAG: NAD-dependent epimerase/dehydratase family protein, partial [Pseudomonadales bacterium]